MDDIDISALLRVMIRGDLRELGRHAQGAAPVILKALGSGDRHAAFAELEVEQLVYLRLIFEQNILARNADIRGAALDVDRNVAGLDPEIAHPRLGILKNQLAVILLDGRTGKARRLKHCVDLFAEPALGQRHIEHGVLRDIPRGRLLDALEHIEVNGEADRLTAALHAVQELVVSAAGEHAVGYAAHKALEDHAVIITAVAHDRKVDLYLRE